MVNLQPRPPARHRDTKQGELVRHVLAAADGFRSAQAVYAQLRTQGAVIGLSTVYRHLQALAGVGEVDVIHDPGGQSIYSYCGAARTGRAHRHLICRACGRAEEIDARVVDRWVDSVARAHGYRDVDQTIEVFGVCPDCLSANQPR